MVKFMGSSMVAALLMQGSWNADADDDADPWDDPYEDPWDDADPGI